MIMHSRTYSFTVEENTLQHRMKENHSRIKLYFSVFVVDLVFFSCGCLFGWSSPSITKLQSPDSWLHVTDAEASWIVSFLPVGAIFGPVISGLLLDSIGRKSTILLNVVLILVSWLLLAIATSVYVMYIARLTGGFACGIAFAVLPIYIAEIAEDSVRSTVNTVFQLFVSAAVLVVFCIGPYISYLLLIIISAVPCIMFLMFSPWLRESPYYLVYKNNVNEAVSSLRWLRGNIPQSQIEQEIEDIKVAVTENTSQKGTQKDMFTTSGGRMATFIIWGLFFCQQMSGISVITFYTEPIFKMTGSSISSSVSAVIFSVFNVIMGAVSPLLVNHFGYKKPLIVSAALMFVAQTAMAIFFFLAIRNYNVQPFNWIPIFMLSTYIIGSGTGLSNIPWALMGELFPTHIKAIGAGITTSFCSILAFITTNIFSDIVNLLGVDYAFGLYGLTCLFAIFFVIFLVPDTSGMSLVEIQALINNPKSCDAEKQTNNNILEINV